MKIYWRIWCPRDSAWHAEGVVDTVDEKGRDHGTHWGYGQTTWEIHCSMMALRDRLGVEPPDVWRAWAPEDARSSDLLEKARGEGICCPHCSTEECVIAHPAETRSCPSCGEPELLDAQVVRTQIRKMHFSN